VVTTPFLFIIHYDLLASFFNENLNNRYDHETDVDNADLVDHINYNYIILKLHYVINLGQSKCGNA